MEIIPGATTETDPEKAEAGTFLRSLLNKNLRIYATDGRLFIGTFKCTDTHNNIVLSLTYEYRHPSQQKLAEAAAAAAAVAEDESKGTVTANMTSRYLGLVVVPGEHITKMEVEEFSSQAKTRSIFDRRDLYGGR
ncbi:Sm-like ribonucleoprotein [Hypoxylon fragiforme]|uniref:Sm-like ribonucleoprotein n=1 Tax=Hypoxylon fragiforme TaxID=63214 RepID=UPI0020C5F664|nr:Sm-like ribonucleoprotein [Hypoxylon fragiforme]KAI2603891.1 Sm-like ribonucleoprotein [Hypoxylon fragiforme]